MAGGTVTCMPPPVFAGVFPFAGAHCDHNDDDDDDDEDDVGGDDDDNEYSAYDCFMVMIHCHPGLVRHAHAFTIVTDMEEKAKVCL